MRAGEQLDHEVERQPEMPLDVRVGQRPPAVLARHLRGPLPAGGLGEVHHAAKQAAVGAHAEDGGRDDPVEVGVRVAVIQQDHVLRRPRVGVPEMGLDPRLPVGVAHGRGAAGEHELAGHEVVVGDGVGREVAQIAQAERAQGVGGGEVVDLLADVPVVTVSAEGRVMLRDRGVGRDVAVEKVERVGPQQVRDRGGRQLPRLARTDSPR